MVNDELFIEALTRIERDPTTWNQGRFPDTNCTTAYCIAGHVLAAAGRDPFADSLGREAAALLGIEYRVPNFRDPDWMWWNGAPLFNACNTLDDLYRISAEHMGIDETVLRDKIQDRLAR